jgi:hypothetical protein
MGLMVEAAVVAVEILQERSFDEQEPLLYICTIYYGKKK